MGGEGFFVNPDDDRLRGALGRRRKARQSIVGVIVDARSQPSGESAGDDAPGEHGNVCQIAFEGARAHPRSVYEWRAWCRDVANRLCRPWTSALCAASRPLLVLARVIASAVHARAERCRSLFLIPCRARRLAVLNSCADRSPMRSTVAQPAAARREAAAAAHLTTIRRVGHLVEATTPASFPSKSSTRSPSARTDESFHCDQSYLRSVLTPRIPEIDTSSS